MTISITTSALATGTNTALVCERVNRLTTELEETSNVIAAWFNHEVTFNELIFAITKVEFKEEDFERVFEKLEEDLPMKLEQYNKRIKRLNRLRIKRDNHNMSRHTYKRINDMVNTLEQERETLQYFFKKYDEQVKRFIQFFED